jgi:undecaprenyl-diphosphatase
MALLKPEDPAIAASSQVTSSDQHLVRDLHTPGLFGRYPLIGLLMILLGGSVFAVLAVSLQTHGPLIQTDIQIANGLHQVALGSSPFVRGAMILGFYLGEHAIFAIGALFVVYYLSKRYWTELSMVVIAWGGELVILFILSAYFNRPRPMFDISVWRQMPSPGFPSGHSISAVLCYGLLAYLIAPKLASRFWRVVVIAAAVLIVLYIGFSRVFVGDHFPVDVLAGYAIGFVWAGLVYTTVELIARRKKNPENLLATPPVSTVRNY